MQQPCLLINRALRGSFVKDFNIRRSTSLNVEGIMWRVQSRLELSSILSWLYVLSADMEAPEVGSKAEKTMRVVH
jgi:hypothetical protein